MTANSETLVDIIHIRNIGNNPVQIGVAPPDIDICINTEATGTDITGFSGSLLFVGSGIVIIQPGRQFTIEESRINLGQIENYINNKQIRAIFLTRKLGDITDLT